MLVWLRIEKDNISILKSFSTGTRKVSKKRQFVSERFGQNTFSNRRTVLYDIYTAQVF